MLVPALAKRSASRPFETVLLERRTLRPGDVRIEIVAAGICHSDLHHAFNDRGTTTYPIVPGHEIAGIVAEIGAEVTTVAIGDRVGVGCTVDSCKECDACLAGMQNYCFAGNVLTYNARGYDGQITYGGYSRSIIVDQNYVLHVPDALPLENAAPMMCAGITLYSPLKHWKAGPNSRVGIIGMGGLGHLGVQLAAALGAHTTVFNLSPEGRDDAIRFGAAEYRVVSDADAFAPERGRFDLLISTVPATFDVNQYLDLLTLDGTFVNLGVPNDPLSIVPHSLLRSRRSISGSLSGGIPETQEMLGFCAEHDVRAEVEVISASDIEHAYSRVGRGDVKYRFVVDVSTIVQDDTSVDPILLAPAGQEQPSVQGVVEERGD